MTFPSQKCSFQTRPFNTSIIALFLLLISFQPLTQANERLDFKQLVAEFEQVTRENPASVSVTMNLGFVYLALAAMGKASATFETATRLDPSLAEAHYWIGRINYLQTKYEKAIPSFQAAINLRPDWYPPYAHLGLCYFHTHNYDEAETALSRADSLIELSKSLGFGFPPPPILWKDPEWNEKVLQLSRADIVHYISQIAFKRGNYGKSAEYCHQTIALDPEYANAFLLLGRVHVQEGAPNAAGEAFLEAISLHPKSGLAHYQLGLLYFKQGRETEANTEMELARQLNEAEQQLLEQRIGTLRNKRKAPVLANLGKIYLNQRKYAEAIGEYEKALWHEADLAEAHNGLGYAYMMLGRLEEAKAAQELAIELNPQMAEAYIGRGLVRLRQAETSEREANLKAALGDFRHAAVLNPQSPESWRNVGNIAFELSRFEEAEAAYQKLLTIQPGLTEVYMALGSIYKRQKKHAMAIRHYQEALKLDLNLVNARLNLGILAAEQGELDEAVELLREEIKIQPDSAEAYYYLGEVYRKQNEYDLAEKAYQDTIQADPFYAAKAYERLAHLYGSRRIDLKRAVIFAEKAVELDPKSVLCLNTLSRMYYLNRDYDRAERAISLALKLNPNNAILKNGLKTIKATKAAQAEGEKKEK